MAEDDPAAAFTAGATAEIAGVSSELAGARSAVASGAVHLDAGAAEALLAAISGIRARTAQLVDDLDAMNQPLHFGHNWVGWLMDDRLRGAATGKGESAQPVLARFQAVLDEVSATVSAAAGRYAAVDQHVQHSLGAG